VLASNAVTGQMGGQMGASLHLEIRFVPSRSPVGAAAERLARDCGAHVLTHGLLSVTFEATAADLAAAAELWRLVVERRSSSLSINGQPIPPALRHRIFAVLDCAARAAHFLRPRHYCQTGAGDPAAWPHGIGVPCRFFMESYGHRLGPATTAAELRFRVLWAGVGRCPFFFDLEDLDRAGDGGALPPTAPAVDNLLREIFRERG
jgi:hypothetical protein